MEEMEYASREQLISNIQNYNNWWYADTIKPFYKKFDKRFYLPSLMKHLENTNLRRAIVLMGPRRVGKTVMIHHAIQKLIDKGVNSRNIIYFSKDSPLLESLDIDGLLKISIEAKGGHDDNEVLYVFIDEIQYQKNWAVHLKTLVDVYHHIKFTVSGSAAGALKKESTESGAGRFTDFMLPPLTFCEYLSLKKLDYLIQDDVMLWDEAKVPFYTSNNLKELNKHFLNYINFGGYPEVALSEVIQENPEIYMREDIVDKVIMKDLPTLYGVRDIHELNALFNMIAFHSGQEFSWDKMTKQLNGISKPTLKTYINYLQSAFLLRIVNRVDSNAKKFKRNSNFKIYLTNPSFRSALFAPIEQDSKFMGNMVENAIYSQWFHRDNQDNLYYAQLDQGTKGEVDIIKLRNEDLSALWAAEIKWSNRYPSNPKDLRKGLIAFCKTNKLKNAIVTTIDETTKITFSDINLHFIPASIYCYSIGKNHFSRINN
jgi:predicted AAA+ superfamily ATPase